MTKDEAERAANEAAELIAAVIRVAHDLDLTSGQTARAVLDSLMACPKTPYWWDALACLEEAGIKMLVPTTTARGLN
jgi:hypothetical protein